MKFLISSLVLILIIGVMLMGCSSFGSRPSAGHIKSFESSKQYNKKSGVFENRRPNLIAEMKKKNMNFKTIKDWFTGGIDTNPSEKLPELKPDLKEFLKESNKLKIIWFGHSTFLLNMDGKIVLFDPVFGKSAAPFDFIVKRFQAPVLSLEELPEIDYIVISHDHYDHLDMKSIKFFKNSKTMFLVPLGVGSYLRGWGVNKNQIIEKDWWEVEERSGVRFIATPAQHFSGRDGIHDNSTLWASWVLQSENHNVYFSGDSGYDTHFKEIGKRFGPFDIAFIESGQYNENWKEVHMLPEESIQSFKDLGAKKLFPVHWGMFQLALHSWYDPIEQMDSLAMENDISLVAPMIGEVIKLGDEMKHSGWWKPFVKKI